MADYTIVNADDAKDYYAGTDVPGEFRRLTDALGAEQVAVTLIRVPPRSDFEQGTGHYHDEIEELYIVARGTLTFRAGDEVRHVSAPSVIRVPPQTPRSHRNEGDEPVEIWAISKQLGREDAIKIDDFWEASPDAAQKGVVDPYEALGISPSFDGDLRALRNRLVKQYSEAGSAPDEERMKAINVAYEALRDVHAPRSRVVLRARAGESFVLDGHRFMIARAPRQPAAIAAPVLAVGFLVLLLGWVGVAVGGAGVAWALWRQWTRRA